MWSEADIGRGGTECFTRGFTDRIDFLFTVRNISINILSVPLIRPCTRHTTKDVLLG